MARTANSMVTVQDLDDMVTFEGYSYNPFRPTYPNLNKCLNKSQVLSYIDVTLNRLIDNNQLVSYSIIEPVVADALTIDPTRQLVSSVAQNYDIVVTSNTSWTISGSVSWAIPTPVNGSNNVTVNVSVANNGSSRTRNATFTFTAGSITIQHDIEQSGSFFSGGFETRS
jgi:hypothetical protein